MNIIAISTLEGLNLDDTIRTIGVVSTIEEASYLVLSNAGDMHETNNQYVVIESLSFGIYQPCHEIHWFQWNEEKLAYEAIETPTKFKNTTNFGIG